MKIMKNIFYSTPTIESSWGWGNVLCFGVGVVLEFSVLGLGLGLGLTCC